MRTRYNITMKFNARQLRKLDTAPEIPRKPVFFILENIYDTYNIGGLFRLADALAIKKLFICGESETPPNHKIKKASIGTDKIVPWEYYKDAPTAINELQKNYQNITVAAIEQHSNSIPYHTHIYNVPIAFVVGNETSGISQQTLNQCHIILEIPMHGMNISLNVIISAAVVSYHAYNVLSL